MKLIGPVGKSFIDIWSVSHFVIPTAGGMLVESQLWSRPICFAAAFIFALLWEVYELHAEKGNVPGRVEHPEAKLNRWVSDLLMATLGYWFGIFLIWKWG